MSTTERTSALTGTWKNGQIVLDEPAKWPEGCRLVVEPIPGDVEALGITDEQWPRTPEAMTKWLEWFDSIEPIEMTREEEANWRAAREAQKAYEIAKFQERAARIQALLP